MCTFYLLSGCNLVQHRVKHIYMETRDTSLLLRITKKIPYFQTTNTPQSHFSLWFRIIFFLECDSQSLMDARIARTFNE